QMIKHLIKCYEYYPIEYYEEYHWKNYIIYNSITITGPEERAKESPKLSFLFGKKYININYEKAYYLFSIYDNFEYNVYEVAKIYINGYYVKRYIIKAIILLKKIYNLIT